MYRRKVINSKVKLEMFSSGKVAVLRSINQYIKNT